MSLSVADDGCVRRAEAVHSRTISSANLEALLLLGGYHTAFRTSYRLHLANERTKPHRSQSRGAAHNVKITSGDMTPAKGASLAMAAEPHDHSNRQLLWRPPSTSPVSQGEMPTVFLFLHSTTRRQSWKKKGSPWNLDSIPCRGGAASGCVLASVS